MTQFELGADCETQLAHARITIETLQMHKATLIKRNDDLRERNAFLMTSAETAQAKLAEARAEVEAVRSAAHMPEGYEYGLPSWINQHLYAAYIGARQSPEVMAMIEDGRLTFPNSPIGKKLAEARAEVERLTPAAKAFWAYIRYLRAPSGTPEEAALATEWIAAFDFIANEAEKEG